MDKKNKSLKNIDFAVGGQAVIEGVMMRSPHYVTVAVRKPNGTIKLKGEDFESITARIKFFSWPIIRGMVNLIEMMIIGMKILNYSAVESLEEEHEEDKKTTKLESFLTALSMIFSIVFALALSLFLFKYIPLWVAQFLNDRSSIIANNYIIFNLIEGTLTTTLFIAYIAILGLAPSLKRVFEYHGAEHKSIYTYENGLELTPKNAKKQSRFHPRCGTSFIITVFIISIIVHTFIPKQDSVTMNFLLRVAVLPLIAGISYEFLKWSAKTKENILVKMLIAPGLWFQRLTTKEPDEKQLEVALASLNKALEMEDSKNLDLDVP